MRRIWNAPLLFSTREYACRRCTVHLYLVRQRSTLSERIKNCVADQYDRLGDDALPTPFFQPSAIQFLRFDSQTNRLKAWNELTSTRYGPGALTAAAWGQAAPPLLID